MHFVAFSFFIATSALRCSMTMINDLVSENENCGIGVSRKDMTVSVLPSNTWAVTQSSVISSCLCSEQVVITNNKNLTTSKNRRRAEDVYTLQFLLLGNARQFRQFYSTFSLCLFRLMEAGKG
jgi:hypothetical protein